MLIYIIISTFIVSLFSFAGLVLVSKKVDKFLHYFIAFAAGALLSAAFFDLIPESFEAFEKAGVHNGSIFILVGIMGFFLIERFIHWHHCGKHDCDRKPVGMLSLIGDGIHNFVDGLLIAGAFMFDFTTGIVTTISVSLHEIPQELGDFSVLLHAGYSKKNALIFNFISGLTAVLGGIIGYFMFSTLKSLSPYMVAFAAGGFLYIALSDIVPDMHKHKHDKKVIIVETLVFIASIILFFFLLIPAH